MAETGAVEYRVVYKRRDYRRKAKRCATLRAAERFLVLLGPEPWLAYGRGKDPDALACCSGDECTCGGLTVREASGSGG